MPSSTSSMRAKAASSPTSGKTELSKEKTYVKHDYQDHYFDPFYDHIQAEESREEGTRRGPRGGVVEPFPSRLYDMLKNAEREGYDNIVGWSPHGRCFVIHKSQQFVEEIMPKYFRQSKLTSFKRQVNLYGFRRLTRGPDSGGYYHPLFLRGRPDLCRRIARTRVKGTGGKPSASPDTEPDFYGYPHCFEVGPAQAQMQTPSQTPPSPTLPHQVSSNPQAGGGFEARAPVEMPPLVVPKEPTKDVSGEMASSPAIHALKSEASRDDKPGELNMDCMTAVKMQKMRMGLGANVRAMMAQEMLEDCNRVSSFDPVQDADSRRYWQERIQEICADPLLESMCGEEETMLRAPSANTIATQVFHQQVEDQKHLGYRPLQPPRQFQNFNNFRPISSQPKLQEVVHNNDSWSNQTHRMPAPTQMPSFQNGQFFERDSRALENQVRAYQDPFQEQIGQLLDAPAITSGGARHAHAMGETDMESVLEWFCF